MLAVIKEEKPRLHSALPQGFRSDIHRLEYAPKKAPSTYGLSASLACELRGLTNNCSSVPVGSLFLSPYPDTSSKKIGSDGFCVSKHNPRLAAGYGDSQGVLATASD